MSYESDVKIKIDADTSSAESAMSQLEKSMNKAFKSPQASVKQMGVQAESLRNKMGKTVSKMGEIGNTKIKTDAYKELEKELDRLKNKAIKTKEHMYDMEVRGKTNTPRYAQEEQALKSYRKDIISTIQDMKQMHKDGTAYSGFGRDTAQYAGLQQRLSMMTHQADILNTRINETKKSTHHLASLVKGLFSMYGKVFRGIGSALKSKITQQNTDASNSFKHLLKQLLKYGLGIRSLFLLYKKLRQYGKEAFKDMAIQYPEINAQLSNLVSIFSQMTHSIATAFQPLLSVVLPILNAIMNAAIAAANAIGSFFAALTGQGFIYKAIKQQKNFAGAVGGTGSAAKEAKEELAEYDKLLVIDQDKGGGGGGGGGAGNGGTVFFEKSELLEGASNLAQMIKDAWKDADFTDVGKFIGEKLTNALNSIPWIKIHETAGKVGKSIATLLNGLISPDLFGALGNTIAQALNTGIEASDKFIHNFKWDNLAHSLATGINTFFKNWKVEQLAQNIHDAITLGAQATATLFREIEFKDIGIKIGNALNKLFGPDMFTSVGTALGEGINGLLRGIDGFVTTFNWKEVGKSIINGLMTAIKTINWQDAGKTVGDLVSGLLDLLTGAIEGLDIKAIGQAILDFLSGIDWASLGDSIVELLITAIATAVDGAVDLFGLIRQALEDFFVEIFEYIGEQGWSGLWEGFWGAVVDIATWIADAFNEHIVQPIKDFFGISSPSKLMEEIGGYVMEGFLNGLTAFWTQIEEWVLGAVQWLEEQFGPVGDVIAAALGANTSVNEVGSAVIDIAKQEQQRQENSKKAKEEADKRGVSTWEVIGDRTGNFEHKSVADIEKSAEHAFEALEKVKESFAELPKSSKKAYNGVTKAFSNSASWAQNTADGISKGFDKMPNEVETKFKGAYTKSTDEFKGINQWARNTERYTATGFNNLPSDVEQKYRSANSQGRAQFDGATDWAKLVVSKIDLGFSGMPREVQERYKKSYTDGISEFANAMQWAQGRSDAIGIGFNGLASLVQNRFRDSYSKGTAEFNNSTNWAKGVANNINNGLSGLPSAIQNRFKQGYSGAQTESNNFVGWLNKQNFTANFKINMPTQNWLQGQWNSLASIWQDQDAEFTVNAKSSFDSLGKLTGFVNAINNAIDQTNYRLLQLKKYGFISNVQTLSHISMPKLAKGGVIPPNQKFIAMLGDQTQGTNIETPLSTMVEAFEIALANGAGAGASTVNVNIDGRQVAQVVWDANERRYKQTGRS